MNEKDLTNDKSTWAIGGGTMLGLGVGFFFLPSNIFAFVGCLLGGIGLGLMVTSLAAALSQRNR